MSARPNRNDYQDSDQGYADKRWRDDFRDWKHRRETIATAVIAQLAPHVMFPQSVEDQLHEAGIKTEDFEAYTAHVACGFAEALLDELEK